MPESAALNEGIGKLWRFKKSGVGAGTMENSCRCVETAEGKNRSLSGGDHERGGLRKTDRGGELMWRYLELLLLECLALSTSLENRYAVSLSVVKRDAQWVL